MTTPTRKPRGYSYDIVKAIQRADQTAPGVRLGAVCVDRNISVTDVATALGVSRQTVYWWFTGRFHPRSTYLTDIRRLIAIYEHRGV